MRVVLATPRTFALLGAARAERIAAGDDEEQADAAVRALLGGKVRLCRVSGAKPDMRTLNTVSTALDGRPSDGCVSIRPVSDLGSRGRRRAMGPSNPRDS